MTNKKGKSKGSMTLFIVLLFAVVLSGCASAPGKGAIPVSAKAIEAGNEENGRKLFMGYAHFENEGPPCMGCHSVGDNGLLGGGSMGPNLTDISERLTLDEMAFLLANSGSEISPVMQPIYTAHPLTVREQADLIAFMISSEGQSETDKEMIVVGISLAGTVGAAMALGFLYRGRLRGVRRPLVNEAQKELL